MQIGVLAVIEREYLRFGVAGIFVSRFLPGIRAVVPPFAGLVNLSPLRTLVPTGIASAIWYGGITILGTVIGAEWGRINRIMLGVHRTLGIITLVLILGSSYLVMFVSWEGGSIVQPAMTRLAMMMTSASCCGKTDRPCPQ